MGWSAGWYGGTGHDRLPAGGRAVPGLDRPWTVGWPGAQVRAAGHGSVALAVIGEYGADKDQLERALPVVRAKGWRALTRWPGSYLTIARSGEVLAVIGDLAGQHPVYWRTDGAGTWMRGGVIPAVRLAPRLGIGDGRTVGITRTPSPTRRT
ncbi:hypothetical protein [Streptomyces lydicus]|uniref:hypothetical protein n=1 Tax=Streptomyces lydicus TaxID=47763 RepID=UPI0037AEB479